MRLTPPNPVAEALAAVSAPLVSSENPMKARRFTYPWQANFVIEGLVSDRRNSAR